jgi:rhamnosyl/mannosyltransferase
MKILQINKLYYPVIGGIETIVKQISEGINRIENFEVDVLVCNDTFKTNTEHINGVTVTKAGSLGIIFSMPVSFSFILLLKRIWHRYDILHLHLPFPLAQMALWLIKPKTKIIVTYHSDIVRQRFLSYTLRWLDEWILTRADSIVVSSPNIIETSPVLIKYKTKCIVIPFGVDNNKFNPENRTEHDIKQIKKIYGEKIVLFVGRLVYYKGLEYLIDAMKDIEARLLIVGEGPLKNKLIRRVNKHGITNKVSFLPFQTQEALVNLYLASTVFVLPSTHRSEAFGITIVEAMACGLPVISTELGTGTSFVNQDRITGFIVPPRNSEAINKALKKLLSDETLLLNMGKRASDRVASIFTLNNMLDKYKKLYKSIA